METFATAIQRVVLVEGMSDKAVVETLAKRQGRDLAVESIRIISVGGASKFGRLLKRFGPQGLSLVLGGLIDADEKTRLTVNLKRAGFRAGFSEEYLARLGFFVCDADLEDEMLRAVGLPQVLEIVEKQGELGAFRKMQRQPAWRDKSLHAQLHRFIGTKSGRKVCYGRLLADAVALDLVPTPLAALLSWM